MYLHLFLSTNHGFNILLVNNASKALDENFRGSVILKALEATSLRLGCSMSPSHPFLLFLLLLRNVIWESCLHLRSSSSHRVAIFYLIACAPIIERRSKSASTAVLSSRRFPAFLISPRLLFIDIRWFNLTLTRNHIQRLCLRVHGAGATKRLTCAVENTAKFELCVRMHDVC